MISGFAVGRKHGAGFWRLVRQWPVWVLMAAVAGCSSATSWLSSSGPTMAQIVEPEATPPIPVIDVSDVVARRLSAVQKRSVFSEVLGDSATPGYVIGAGDSLDIAVWEAPPAALFGMTVLDPRLGPATSRAMTFPDQMVAADGTITVPFAGAIPVAGKLPQEVEKEIVRRLTGKANQPQALVRVTHNASANVTVVGEVAQSQRMPLTTKGERLLDAMAAAGGVKQPVGKTTIQLSRNGQVFAMPLDAIIRDPRQNIMLRPGDVLTALYQPLSFTALGAAGKNEEFNFEAEGITLAQAFGRIGGLVDGRANARGVFLFRFEEPEVVSVKRESLPHTLDGKVPVVYRIDLKDPRTFLIAQNFPVRDKDVIYVANAPAADLQKFLNILTSSIFSVTSLVNLAQ